jgi:FMN phosphatase YigB (HAD superfamily)
MLKKTLLSLCLCLATSNQLLPHVIVFDIGEVLLTTNKFQAFKQLGIMDTIIFGMKEWSNISGKLRTKMFELLTEIKPFDSTRKYETKDENGILLPPLMVDWLTGTNPKEIRKKALDYCKQKPSFFKNSQERGLIEQLIKLMFTPEIFIKTRTQHKEIVKQLQRIAAKKEHTLLICSNWDTYSFELCKKSFPEIFSHFDGFIVSGYTQNMKPSNDIFDLLKAAIDELPAKKRAGKTSSSTTKEQSVWFFIDDQKENRVAARKNGFLALHPDELACYCKKYGLY